jgi:hypothetical protein
VTPAPSLVQLFIAPLNRGGVEYMVTGGLASIVYGHPRLAGGDPLNAWGLHRRIVRRIEAIDVQIAPIEYVIVNKLLYFRIGGSDRHLRDIARMLEINGPAVDEASLDEWIARLNLGAEYTRAREFGSR